MKVLPVFLQATPSKAVMQLFGAVAAAQLAFAGTIEKLLNAVLFTSTDCAG